MNNLIKKIHTVVIILFLNMLLIGTVFSKIEVKKVTYPSKKNKIHGNLIWDNSTSKKRSCVIIVHETPSLNIYANEIASKLAELGYLVLAIKSDDNFTNSDHPKDINEFNSIYQKNSKEMKFRLARSISYLKMQNMSNKKIVILSYCMGTKVSMNLLRDYTNDDKGFVNGIIACNGSISPEKEKISKRTNTKLFIIRANKDDYIDDEEAKNFADEMRSKGIFYTAHRYTKGIKHGFMIPYADDIASSGNETLPMKFNKEKKDIVWNDIVNFLDANL